MDVCGAGSNPMMQPQGISGCGGGGDSMGGGSHGGGCGGAQGVDGGGNEEMMRVLQQIVELLAQITGEEESGGSGQLPVAT